MKRIKILALVLALAALLLPAHAMADDAQITVTGTGAVAYKPDTAMITLGVSEVAQGAVDAQSIVNGKIDAVKKALSGMGVAEKDIAVGDLSLWGTYDYSGEMQKLTGYMASHSLTITTTDMDAVGPLIDAALSAGANQLNGVNFSVKNNSAAYDKALALAAEKARAKAEVLAAATGAQLGKMESLTEGNDYGYSPYIAANVAMSEDGGAPTQVDTGMVTITATVTATYNLKD